MLPRNRLPRIMKHYSPTDRRNYGRHLKRLLDTWDRNGSTSGPTPWQIDDDDDNDDDELYVSIISELKYCRINHFKPSDSCKCYNSWATLHFVTAYLCLSCDSRNQYILLGVLYEVYFCGCTSAVPFAGYHEISYRSPLQYLSTKHKFHEEQLSDNHAYFA